MTRHSMFPSDGVALIIGGTGGLGKEISSLMAESGSNVALTYRKNKEEAAKISSMVEEMGRKSMFEQMTIEDANSVQEMVNNVIAAFGSIHTVVYTSGPDIALGYINQISHDEWRRVIDTDVNGFFNVIHATLPHLRDNRAGTYISVITAAVQKYPSRDSLSAVPKAAVEMLTKAVSREEGKFGIRANCVGPGMIEAGIGTRMLEEGFTASVRETMKHDISLRKFGEARDIAEAVVFLASSRAKHITGQTIFVDGGWVHF